ncbi:hydroxyisourate hydrolase [Nocardia puris]|uniref:hydroxyisourate hydrolase n=1 Tax=Nocardia puris TaxID=208602 RepID=UPI00189333BC|nr:hydroxyisourate hydrolase [Nocardia puris]MBF6211287.1 hydroxyisourate hydrolase [Nocardia puris]MBF6365006.1 hydroxyisourate hydrolase [Nocardia puris]MBF6458791.1 hydroxyisourate hydrolase [Nocardia puris]
MSTLSTHVLDAVVGAPAVGVAVTLFSGTETVGSGVTDCEGRIAALGGELAPGVYRIAFESGDYFARQRVETFYPEVAISFTVGGERHYHVPLLLSPFAFSTYRGS